MSRQGQVLLHLMNTPVILSKSLIFNRQKLTISFTQRYVFFYFYFFIYFLLDGLFSFSQVDQSYSKAVKNELKDNNGQGVKAETEDPTFEPSPTEVPTADEGIPQLEEAVAAVAIDTQVEHQAAGESFEAYEGVSEPVVDGADANADVRDGGNINGGYNKYQGDRNYRNNNNMNGNRQQRTSYNNSGTRSNNRQNMSGVAAASTAGAAAQALNANPQYYMDANGVYYMYYPAYGGYYPVDTRYV
jgi:hypothetical protein